MRQNNNNNTQISSNITTSVSGYRSEDSQNSQVQNDIRNRMVMKYDENIAKIVSLGMEDKLIKSQYSKVDINDALVKVSNNLNMFSVKQSANFLFAISKLLSHGYLSLNQELKDFFSRFKDHIMKQQQKEKEKEKQHRSSRKQQTKKRLRDAARDLADNLSGAGSSIDERSNTSIQQPRHISTEERLNLQEQNIISPMAMMMQRGELDLASSSENSNGFSDQMLDPTQQQRLQMLGQDDANIAGLDFDGGAAFDYDGFQYDFSDRDSQSQGFENKGNVDISQQLKLVGDMSERYIRKIATYANQQSSKKKKKTNSKHKGNARDGEQAILNESVDQDKHELTRAMDERLNQFFSQASHMSVNDKYQNYNQNYSDIGGQSTTLQQPSILSQAAGIGIGEESITDAPFLPQSFLNHSMTHYLNASSLVDQPIVNLAKKFDEAMQLKDNSFLISEELIQKLEKTMQNITIDIPKYGEDNAQQDQNIYDQFDDQQFIPDYHHEDSSSHVQDNPDDNDRDGHKDNKLQNQDQSEDGFNLSLDQVQPEKKNLTEEEKKRLSHYEKLLNKLNDSLSKEQSASFNNVFQSFKNQKNKAELFYDFLELQKLGQLNLTQEDCLHFSPIYIKIN